MLSSFRKSLRKQPQVSGDSDSDSESHVDEAYALHPDSHPEGGLTCRDEELLRVQGKAVNDWVRAMGKKLLSGSVSLSTTPFPVSLFEPRSYLEKLADVYVYPRFLKEAASASSPVERIKLVGTWVVAGLHKFGERWKKPFNPILGETWQASLSDGSMIFVEQVSHHPPVSAIQIDGPGWRFIGSNEAAVSLVISSYGFKAAIRGYRCVEFADGTRIEMTLPSYVMKNVVYSKCPRAEIEGEAVISDPSHGLKLVLKFGAVSKATKSVLKRTDAIQGELLSDSREEPTFRRPVVPLSVSKTKTRDEDGDEYESADETDFDLRSLKIQETKDLPPSSPSKPEDPRGSASGRQAPPTPPTPSFDRSSRHGVTANNSSSNALFSKFMRGLKADSIGGSSSYSSHYPQYVLSRAEGSWVSHLEFDSVRYWNLVTEIADTWRPDPKPLVSDSRFRQDLSILAQGSDLVTAQAWKDKLEESQRHDSKMRKQGQSN